MKNTKSFIIPLIIVILICAIFATYFYKFNNGLSKYSNDWGNFGDYIGGFSSLVFSFALFWFTYRADKREEATIQTSYEIELLKQIESTLIKIHKYEKIDKEINQANIYERGGMHKKGEVNPYDEKCEIKFNLEIELFASYETLKILAKICGKEAPKTNDISVETIKKYIISLKLNEIQHLK